MTQRNRWHQFLHSFQRCLCKILQVRVRSMGRAIFRLGEFLMPALVVEQKLCSAHFDIQMLKSGRQILIHNEWLRCVPEQKASQI
jgi:hypothetical protein